MSCAKRAITVSCLVLSLALAACADQRTDLSDETSMAVYRDCINAMPGGPDTHAVSSALSNTGAGQPASVNAAVSSNVQAQKEVDCARMAGWKN
jgi:hypothetical protein